jgi:hypothetical protein
MGKRYRNLSTGDIGVMIERGGKKYVRYPRGLHSPEAPYTETEWEPYKEEYRDLVAGQRAPVAFAADKALCRMLGQFKDAQVLWDSLMPEEKVRWGDPDNPPMEGGERRKLYMYVHRGLGAKKDGA